MTKTVTTKIPFWPFVLSAIALAIGKTTGLLSVKWSTIFVVGFFPQLVILAFIGGLGMLVGLIFFMGMLAQAVDALDSPARRY
jgi:hypothetical protein